MASKGWVSIHRNLFDHWIWNDKSPFDKRAAWIDLLLMVNHQNKKVIIDGNLIEIKRGQRITSIRKLCDRWKWSNTKVKNFLETLEKDEMILLKIAPHKATLITIVNYDKYQDVGDRKNDTETSLKHQSSITEASLKHLNNNDITMINNDNNDDDIYKYILYIQEALQKVTGKEISSSQINKFLKKYGADKMDLLIQKINESEWLKKNIDFNRIGQKFLNKVLSGYYKDFEFVNRDGQNKFNNSANVNNAFTEDELERLARQKRDKLFKSLGDNS